MKFDVLAVALIATAVGASAAQNVAAPFSISIAANQTTTKPGDPLIVSIILENLSDDAFSIKTSGIAEGETLFDIAMRDSSGNPAPFTRYCKSIKGIYQGPGPQTIIGHNFGTAFIKPQQSEKWTSNVSKCFELQPGTYTVQASFSETPSKQTIVSNTIKVTIVK